MDRLQCAADGEGQRRFLPGHDPPARRDRFGHVAGGDGVGLTGRQAWGGRRGEGGRDVGPGRAAGGAQKAREKHEEEEEEEDG